jgi:hypothetical protein
MTRYLVPLTYPEAIQAIEALSNRAESMRHRVTLGTARLEDVSGAIVDCAMAEAAIRDAVGLGFDDEWSRAVKLGCYDPSDGEAHDPLPDIALAMTGSAA